MSEDKVTVGVDLDMRFAGPAEQYSSPPQKVPGRVKLGNERVSYGIFVIEHRIDVPGLVNIDRNSIVIRVWQKRRHF